MGEAKENRPHSRERNACACLHGDKQTNISQSHLLGNQSSSCGKHQARHTNRAHKLWHADRLRVMIAFQVNKKPTQDNKNILFIPRLRNNLNYLNKLNYLTLAAIATWGLKLRQYKHIFIFRLTSIFEFTFDFHINVILFAYFRLYIFTFYLLSFFYF